jgi:hypothetical protein
LLNFPNLPVFFIDVVTVSPKLKCFYTNADQLFNKLPELMVRTRDNQPDIIGITGVKNKNNRQNPSIAEYSIGEVGTLAGCGVPYFYWRVIGR